MRRPDRADKADLVPEDGLERVEALIRATLPHDAKILRAAHGAVSAQVLLGLAAAAEGDLLNRPSHHDAEDGHDHDDFTSFVVELPARPIRRPGGRGWRTRRRGMGCCV